MKKWIGLIIFLFSLSVNSFASLPSPSTTYKYDVNVPCFKGGFTVGVEALYLRASASDLDYAVTYPTTLFVDGTFQNVEPHYNWGWRVDVGYLFPCSGNDIILTYTDYSDKEFNSVTGPASLVRGTFTVFALGLTSPSYLFAKSKFNYQAYDLDFGQHVNVNCNWRTRWFGGLRYADLVHRFETRFMNSSNVADNTVFIDASKKNQFHGIGPRLGMDFAFNVYQGIGIVGHTAAALLIGTEKTKYNELDVAIATGLIETQNYNFGSETRVVPNLDARLGLGYSTQFCNCQKTRFFIELGYMVDHYFNSIDRVGETTSDEPDDQIRHSIDTSFDGPYLRVQVNV